MQFVLFQVFKCYYGYTSQEQEWCFMEVVLDSSIDELFLMAGQPSLGWTLEQEQR